MKSGKWKVEILYALTGIILNNWIAAGGKAALAMTEKLCPVARVVMDCRGTSCLAMTGVPEAD